MLTNLLSMIPSTSKVEVISHTKDATTIPVDNSLLSFFDLFAQADLVVKSVIMLLIILSISSWAIIIEKIATFAKARYSMSKFEKRFWSGETLDILFKRVISERELNPLAQIFISTMQEWNSSDKNEKKYIKDRMLNTIHITANRSTEEISKNVGFLATVASSAPFIGLFGTVWGIMSSFQSIAANKNATLAVVAPGIAEALFATAMGLIIAIPAAIFYNKFSSDINKIAIKVENFSLELSNLISKELEKVY